MTIPYDKPVTVVLLESLSYSGTTWLNLVLGCHDRALAIGPADRIQKLDDPSKACLVHGGSCEFWPAFLERYDRSSNFFTQLAEYSGRDFIVTNNLVPTGMARELRHPRILVKRIRMVRDGRALMLSWLRNFGSMDKNVFDAIDEFVLPGMRDFRWDPLSSSELWLRYEQVVQQPHQWLATIGEFLGLDYSPDALRFWEHELHPVTGNQGTISLIKFAQGIPVREFANRSFYETEIRRLSSGNCFNADRWKNEITRGERFVFDLCCGDYNESFGYERDQFGLEEIHKFMGELVRCPRSAKLPKAVATIRDRFANFAKPLSGDSKSQRLSIELGRRLAWMCRDYLPHGVLQMIPGSTRALLRHKLGI